MVTPRWFRATRAVVGLVTLAVLSTGTSAVANDLPEPQNVTAPIVSGTPRWGERLTTSGGTWDPADTRLTFQWLRAGKPIPGETGPTYRMDDPADLGRTLSVKVIPVVWPKLAVTSASTGAVQRAVLKNTTKPLITGTRKYQKVLTAGPGRWSAGRPTFGYQWFSAGKRVKGATGKKYTVRPADVGHTIRVEITASRVGHITTTVSSPRTGTIRHAVRARKTVTYSVRTRGKVTQSVSTFKRLAQETFDDPRGWRSNGIAFRRVSKGGSFTLVLSQASKVPTFSSGCSSAWSCRVGRNVIINQNRWRSATSSWNRAGGSLRDYRTMVINHEVGHWLGKGHATCSGRRSLAPVMMQQSKGLKSCRFNPWPKPSERYSPRYHF